jgi:GTP-binding protein
VVLDPPLPAVAFVGRSNVGKSSLLNALLGRRIAKVSGTPGKTRLLNVYQVTFGSGERGAGPSGATRDPAAGRDGPLPAPRSLYFFDLPGYGYARAGKVAREGFRRLVSATLDRPGLAGVVWLLDIRHDPSADDRVVQDELAARRTRVLAALTKSDKLPRGRRLDRGRLLRDALGLEVDQAITTSATTGEGIDDLREAIAALVTEDRS